MHVTILAVGSRGDVQPLATLGRGLQSVGHQVCFITTENYAPLITAHGLDLWPIPGDSEALVRAAGADMLSLVRSFGSLARGEPLGIPEPVRKTDVIINQLPLAILGYDLAEKFNVPMIVAAVIPLFPTRDFQVMGFPPLPWPGYNRLSYSIAQWMGRLVFSPVVNRWRKQVLQLPPLPWRGYLHQMGTARYPMLNGFSEQVVPRPRDWGEHVHITGYWFPKDDTWQPPADLRAFIESGPPPVFIGFGSMPVRHPEQTTDVIVEALRQSGQRGVLHTGWGDLGQGDLPAHIWKLNYAPYGWLFPRMALIIHHGGSGTTAFGLRAGVPSLAAPFLFDQFFWGERIAALGVGPRPIPFKQMSVKRLAQAIAFTVNDQPTRQRANALGQKIRAEDGLANAIDIIQRIVRNGAWPAQAVRG
jgi:sterol 3beta-glucosyltransferase